jgi:hypothetical protein
VNSSGRKEEAPTLSVSIKSTKITNLLSLAKKIILTCSIIHAQAKITQQKRPAQVFSSAILPRQTLKTLT